MWLACVWPASWAADTPRMQQAAQRQGPLAQAALPHLQTLLQLSTTLDEAARLEAINDFFNRRIAFAGDRDVWGVVDHWASPLELLGQGRGDCEDYAIAKYFGLLAMGVPEARLRLVYVRAQVAGESLAHMVLAYYAAPEGEPLVLDNLVPAVLPAAERPDLQPLFSFNSQGLWQGVGGPSAGDPLARLSRWREVLAKARDEGF